MWNTKFGQKTGWACRQLSIDRGEILFLVFLSKTEYYITDLIIVGYFLWRRREYFTSQES